VPQADRGAARAALPGVIPNPNVPGGEPQHGREGQPRIGLVPHQRLGPARLGQWSGRVATVNREPKLGGKEPWLIDRPMSSSPDARAPSSDGPHAIPSGSGFGPPYDISYGGLKLRGLSAALGRYYLRRGADLP